MQCPTHFATISPDICIKRQKMAAQGFATKKIQGRIFETALPESFVFCKNCTTGKLVKLFPSRYIKKDFLILMRDQIKILKERGFVFKTELDLVSLLVAERNEDLNELERIELIDYIAEISKKLVIERRLNGKTNRVLSTTGCRIARYLRKQRCSERNQQIDSSSIGA